MPLTPDEFDSRRRDVGTAVYWFLKSRSPIAFSAEEVVFELGALSIILDFDAVRIALRRLEEREIVEAVLANGSVYYRYVSQLGFRPPRN